MCLNDNIMRIKIPSLAENVSVVESFIDNLKDKISLSDNIYGNILISVTEAVNNAIVHGNKENRATEISEISRNLKALARELNVPIIALSQLSRQVESRDDKRPLLSDLRESGAIEQDADIVMFVYRDEYYLQNNQPPPGTEQHTSWLARMDEVHGKAEVLIRKHRHGPTSNVQLQFEERLTKFSDLARENYLPERFE